MAYHPPQRQWRHLRRPAPQPPWREIPLSEPLTVLPGLTYFYPPPQMARMCAAYTRARQADPQAFPTFQHFILARVTAGLAERCISLSPGTEHCTSRTAGEFLNMQLQLAAQQLGVDQKTLLYWLVVPEQARREQRWQAARSLFAYGISARWGRHGCAASVVGLGAIGILLCCLLSIAEAIAAFLLQHPR